MAHTLGETRIESILASARAARELDLAALAPKIRGARLHGPGADVMHVELEGGAGAAVFSDGTVRLAGARSTGQLAELANALTMALVGAGATTDKNIRFEVQSCCASVDLRRKIDTGPLAGAGPFRRARRAPPGPPGALCVRFDDAGGDVLVFPEGRIVVYGAMTIQDARRSIETAKKGVDELD